MNEWVWSIGGMILTGETEVLGEKLVQVSLCPQQSSHINYSTCSYIYHRTFHTFHITWQQNSSCILWLLLTNPVKWAAELKTNDGRTLWQPAEGFVFISKFIHCRKNITWKHTEAAFSRLLIFVLQQSKNVYRRWNKIMKNAIVIKKNSEEEK